MTPMAPGDIIRCIRPGSDALALTQFKLYTITVYDPASANFGDVPTKAVRVLDDDNTPQWYRADRFEIVQTAESSEHGEAMPQMVPYEVTGKAECTMFQTIMAPSADEAVRLAQYAQWNPTKEDLSEIDFKCQEI